MFYNLNTASRRLPKNPVHGQGELIKQSLQDRERKRLCKQLE